MVITELAAWASFLTWVGCLGDICFASAGAELILETEGPGWKLGEDAEKMAVSLRVPFKKDPAPLRECGSCLAQKANSVQGNH